MPSAIPVPDDEDIYRRVPLDWYRPSAGQTLKLNAFLPMRADDTGLSVDQVALRSIEQAASGRPGKRYHLIRISVRELRRVADGIDLPLTVVRDPTPENPAHALIPEINRVDYDRDPATKQRIKALANTIVWKLMRPGSALGQFVLVALEPETPPME